MKNNKTQIRKVALVTGAAKRLGAHIARGLHALEMDVFVHYQTSKREAYSLVDELNASRAGSAYAVQADLRTSEACHQVIDTVQKTVGRLDVLVNNASRFYQTPLDDVTEAMWDDVFSSNLQAPFFLAQRAARLLRAAKGTIVNMGDVHAERPMTAYSVYCMSKAGLVMLTKALAKEWGPDIRVNAVAPSGGILWPDAENALTEAMKEKIIAKTALKTAGSPRDIVDAVLFLVTKAEYITGQIIVVDGGRSLQI